MYHFCNGTVIWRSGSQTFSLTQIRPRTSFEKIESQTFSFRCFITLLLLKDYETHYQNSQIFCHCVTYEYNCSEIISLFASGPPWTTSRTLGGPLTTLWKLLLWSAYVGQCCVWVINHHAGPRDSGLIRLNGAVFTALHQIAFMCLP